MKIKLIILILTSYIGLQGCAYTKTGVKSPKEIFILPYNGIDSIFVGISTKKDVLTQLGQTKIEHKWRPNSYPIELGEFVQVLYYPEYGLTFLCDHKNGRRFARKTVREIVIDSTSQIKTLLGNGVGSSYYQIISEFGNTKFSRGSFPTSSITHLTYDKLNEKNIYTIMHFQQYSIVDTIEFQVKKISIKY